MASDHFSYANLTNLSLIENLFAAFLENPESVDSSWRQFFEGVEFASSLKTGRAESSDVRTDHLILAYRTYGHLAAHINPLELHPPQDIKELALSRFGFSEKDLESQVSSCGYFQEPTVTLKKLLTALQKTYSHKIGIEYMNFVSLEMESWLQKKIEPSFNLTLSKEEKIGVLKLLNRAELFESFLHIKYVGQKRFSAEGGETLIPILAAILDAGIEDGAKEALIGMAHRARLNVLANILGKSYVSLFAEFETHYIPDSFEGTGDVKYHKGFVSKRSQGGKEIQITLSPNPSHLEAVDPVVEGLARAFQEKIGERGVIPILIHGDAAVAGQGVVYETMQLSRLNGYKTGGTIHIVINNQIGFTTAPKDARSTLYCTDLARTFGAPVFHVNAEDPEGAVLVARMAAQIRQKFQCDVFIDLNCYRRYGHNEGDEPAFTQPLDYQIIRSKKSIRAFYRERLLQEGVLDQKEADLLEENFKKELEEALQAAKNGTAQDVKQRVGQAALPITSVPLEELKRLGSQMCYVPEGFAIHPKVLRLLNDRSKMLEADPSTPIIDWGMGEHLAYATLLMNGKDIRISGQDVRRGTFSHRHAMLVDQKNGERYFPLSHLKEGQGNFSIYNSPLSEFAVLGFEFGYNLASPNALVIWEAQYGDFSNGAQVIIDQFLTTSEQKWAQESSLVLQLPHGYEGQGPEHSSARLERFLQLAGNNNIQVVNCTKPGQFFHLLRRQVLQSARRPLIIFTPKKMLRDPDCLSCGKEFVEGSFEEILDDPLAPLQATRLLFCSGKIYYDLVKEAKKRNLEKVAVIRMEQLYPLKKNLLEKILKRYSSATSFFWVQEEPRNMGAWEYIQPLLTNIVKQEIQYAGRERSAATAVGSHALHEKEYHALMDIAFKDQNES